MKALFLILISCVGLHAAPTICLNMIVKNESPVIRRCLESVKPLIDTWVIVDTGSTDGTQEIIKEFLKDIPGELHERPWINFEHNRNEALALAKDKADYLFFIDADDILRIDPQFNKAALNKDCYEVKFECGTFNCVRLHLVKSSLDWQWKGVVHEVIGSTQAQPSDFLQGAAIVMIGDGARSRDPQKYLHDALLLEEALANDPDNTQYLFFLAQCYSHAKMYDLSLQNYKKLIQKDSTCNDLQWAHYQIASLQEMMGMPEEIVVKGYLDAYNHYPERIEPLYRLTNYYRRQEKHLLAYLLSRHALQVQPPEKASFVEAWIYEWGILLEYSICAYWIGRYEESYHLTQLLLSNPNLPSSVRQCAENNREFAKQKLPPGTLFHPLKKPPQPAPRNLKIGVPQAQNLIPLTSFHQG